MSIKSKSKDSLYLPDLKKYWDSIIFDCKYNFFIDDHSKLKASTFRHPQKSSKSLNLLQGIESPKALKEQYIKYCFSIINLTYQKCLLKICYCQTLFAQLDRFPGKGSFIIDSVFALLLILIRNLIASHH